MVQRYCDWTKVNEDKTDDISFYKRADALPEADDPLWDKVKDGTIFINGSVASFRAAAKLCENKSTAPYKAVDNDNDGTVDALFIYDYTIATVKAVDDDSVQLLGLGDIAKSKFAVLPELAANDYVAVYSAAGKYYAKKLEVKDANVTGVDGSKLTIDGVKCEWSKHADAADKSLTGTNANALTETVYTYVFDDNYIVDVNFSENTKFAKYAIVAETANLYKDTYLGFPYIRLYTEDNEYVNAYVKNVNGYQIYAYQNNFRNLDIQENDLVSYTLDGDFVYLDVIGQGDDGHGDAGDANDTIHNNSETFDGATVSDDYDFTFDAVAQTWNGQAKNGTVAMLDTYGVVFVSYMGGFPGTFRAYYNGEFQPNTYNEFEGKIPDGNNDLVVYVSQNGFNYIKAAVMTFDYARYGYALPGLPTTREGDNFSIIKSTKFEQTTEGVVYTYTVYTPWNGGTKEMTSIPFPGLQTQPSGDTVWNLKTNSDGLVTAHIPVNMINDKVENFKLLEDTAYAPGFDGMEMYAYPVVGLNVENDGSIRMALSVINPNDQIATHIINVSKDAEVWFFDSKYDKNDTFDYHTLTAKNYLSYVGANFNNVATRDYVAYVDMNPTTRTANRVILIAGDFAAAKRPQEVTVTLTGFEYNTINHELELDLTNATISADVDADVLDELYYVLSADLKEAMKEIFPWDAEYPVDKTVDVTFKRINNQWQITAIKGNEFEGFYSNTIATKIDGHEATDGVIYAGFDATGFTWKVATDKVREEENIAAVYAYRMESGRVELLYSNDEDVDAAYETVAEVNAAFVSNLSKTIDEDPTTYEGFIVVDDLTKGTDEAVIVLIDASVTGKDEGSAYDPNDAIGNDKPQYTPDSGFTFEF